MRLRPFLLIVAAALLLVGTFAPLAAQDSQVVLSVVVPDYLSDVLKPELFAQFEADNPTIKVNLVKTSSQEMNFPSPAASIDDHLKGVEKYASKADVLLINGYNMSVEATRAGYFLDLTSFINADSSLNADDFIPAIWKAYQWDGGTWALPAAANVSLLMYKPAAFDKAGLAYPDENWTLTDLANAADKLAIRDSKGGVKVPGFLGLGNMTAVFVSQLSQRLYDAGTTPNAPQLANPALEQALDEWVKLDKEVGNNVDFSDFDPNDVPLRVDQTYLISGLPGSEKGTWAASLLPGGKAGLTVNAFAVSGASQYPEQAYQLAKYLTSSVDIVNRFFADTPARKSLENARSDTTINISRSLTPEEKVLIQKAIDNSLPISDLRFGDYLDAALNKMRTDNIDAHTALQELETQANTNLQQAAALRGQMTAAVATPMPTPVLNQGEIDLKFAMTSFISPLPNEDKWDEAIQEFTGNDPQVKHITMETGFTTSLADTTSKYDCFYMPFNLVAGNDDLSQLTNLDPYMSADASFDQNDVIGNILPQLQRDNKTWGFPLIIQPQILRYNTTMFEKAAVPAPDDGWNISQFNDALRALKINPEDKAPFVPSGTGGTYLFILMAAYGGVPLDYRTNPPTVNFTDPAAVNAMRQVLDLAKQGYLKYSRLGSFIGGFGGGGTDIPIYDEAFSFLRFYAAQNANESGKNDYRMTTYPRGEQFTGISYDIGSAYISASSQNAEACYRWISYLGQHPALFLGMPARRSQASSSDITATQGQDITAFYQQLDRLMQDPNTIAFPSPFGGGNSSPGNFLLQIWLYRVFDKYVLDNGDLDAELEQAQIHATDYQGCIANIPPFDPYKSTTQKEQLAYFKQFTDCAVKADPSLSSLFSFMGG
jgi:ABC-type glycerol-3-phosphate transport system substrate-binding protein